MRKTLTAIVVILAAGSLAACKMPWDKEKDPPPPPVAQTTSDTAAGAEAKPVEQIASNDKPATPAVPQAAPAAK